LGKTKPNNKVQSLQGSNNITNLYELHNYQQINQEQAFVDYLRNLRKEANSCTSKAKPKNKWP